MALTLTPAGLAAALRLGDSAEEVAESTRLLTYVMAAISRHLGDAYEAAPEAVVNEAGIRLAGYLFDQPNAGRGLSFANAGRNSGAWVILLPYRIHRAGSTGDAVAAAQAAVGSTGNPVVGVALTTDELIVSFADGTVETTPFTPGSGGGADQTARDAAAAAQTTADGRAVQADIDSAVATHTADPDAHHTPPAGGGADQTARDAAAAAQGTIDAHEATPHNTDTLARSTAVDARQVGEAAQATADALRTELETHEATPHGGGGGADQTARDAAATAQGAAATAQADLDAHEASTHNTDQTARTAAADARATAEQSQADLDAHEATPHNFDTIARDAAADAQSSIADHERAPHNTDGTARAAASAAQARADDAYTLADGKVDSSGAASAARGVVADWGEAENPDPIPAPKLVNVINAHEDIVNVLDGRLPGLPVAMRLGWSQREDFIAFDFTRPSPPIGGSVAGMSDGLSAPPFPPSLASDPTLYLGIWLAGDPDIVEIDGGGAQFGNQRSLTIDGDVGVYFVSTDRLGPLAGTIFSITLTGPRLVTEDDLAAHAGDPNAHHVPPAGGGGGGGAGLQVSTAEIQFLRSTTLVEVDSQPFTSGAWSNLQRDGADLVCPTAGQVEFFMQAKSGGRDNSIAFAKIPAAEIRATPTNGEMQIPLGANRWFGIRTNSLADQHIQLKGQDGQTSVDGDYSVRVSHFEEVIATFVTGVTSGGGGA